MVVHMAREGKAQERYILCIDGGGMRGVIPSYLLAKFSECLIQEGDSRPLVDHFDLIAGTSTGGIIALALTCPAEKARWEATVRHHRTFTNHASGHCCSESCAGLPSTTRREFFRRR